MARLNRDRWNTEQDKRRPLNVEDMGGHKYAVLTITDVRADSIPDSTRTSGYRDVVRVGVAEFGDEVWYYPNFAGVQAMMEQYGEETDDWRGKPLILNVTETKHPVTKRMQPALHVAPVAEWKDILAANVRDDDARAAGARKGTAKRGTRR